MIVALDTTMTPDLQRKALARHLVHQIQLTRKEARFNVHDRIRISVELRCGSPPGGWLTREVDLEEARVNVAVGRA